jgi:membrane fusion protein (multidrug efflux system)
MRGDALAMAETIPKKKQILIALGAVAAVLVVLAGIKGLQIHALIKAGAAYSQPAETITTAQVRKENWQSSFSAVGSVLALKGIMVTSELAGTIRQIAFESGQTVKEGALLVKLDTTSEQAELASAQANANLAEADLARAQQLQAANVSSAAELDTARAKAEQARAAVQNAQAIISKKTIRAPFAGRLGIRQVDLGEFVQPGQPIVGLESVGSVYVDFWLPQQALAQVQSNQVVTITSDTFKDKKWIGKVETVNSSVDPNTRNVQVRATIDNKDSNLKPGMFVNVQVDQPIERSVLIIPETAILHAPYGDSVFAVENQKDEKTGKEHLAAKQVFVRLGERRGDYTVVESGLEEGQTIVSSGAFKLSNNMPVVVNNDLAPQLSENPNPENQ